MPREFNKGCGCLAMILSVVFGTPLAFIGMRNFTIRKANPEIKKVALKDLVTSQPETPLWVEVSGVPVDGSYVKDLGYMLLRDPKEKMAVYLSLPVEAPPLSSKNNEPLVIRGMISKASEGTLLPMPNLVLPNVPPDVKVIPLLLEKDHSPPSWFASWGLIMLAAAIFAATATIIGSWKRRR